MRNALAGLFVLGLILAIPEQSFGIYFGPGWALPINNATSLKPCTKVAVEIGAPSQLVELDAYCLMIEFVNHKALSPVEVTVGIPEEYEITAEFPLEFSGEGNPYLTDRAFSVDSYCYPTNFAHIFVYLHGNFDYFHNPLHEARSIAPRFIVSVRAVN